MTDATFSPSMPHIARLRLIPSLFGAEPRFAMLSLLLAFSMIPTGLALQIDPRLFQGDSIWSKPLKFQFALTVYLLSLAFFARFLPATFREATVYRSFITLVVFCVVAEMAWIGGAAMFGTASHFNLSSMVMSGLYGIMGLFAVLLTSASLVYGLVIWRHPHGLPDTALRLSVALGLGLTFVLTVIVAGYLSAQSGHLVGVPVTGAQVPIMGWSREVGDLRLPHFLATHAMHVIPLAGVLAVRLLPSALALWTVWGVAAGFVAVTLASFVMAINGVPVFPL